MRSLFKSITLVAGMILLATGISAQGVHIYKNGQRQTFRSQEVDSIVFFYGADENPTVIEKQFEMPSNSFGSTLDAVMAAEQARGFDVVKNSDDKLTATKTTEVATYSWEYRFDKEGCYKYAKCNIATGDEAAFKAFLRKSGFVLQPEASANGEVSVYANAANLTSIVIDTRADGADYYYGAYDEDAHSWTRIAPLKDVETGTWMPFYGKYAPVELMKLYEKRMGHILNTTLSKPEKGIYVYQTADSTWTTIKYWYDVATKSALEETAIYVDTTHIPTPASVTAYLKTMGYTYTSMTDNEGYVVYYNRKIKSACYVLMADKTEGQGIFAPVMHYAYTNLDGQVPPETVDFPMPLVEFGTMTMDEALAWFKEQPYYESDETSELGPTINTTSKDFPIIVLLEDGGKYYASLVITNDNLAIRSPYITNMLVEKGYEYAENVSILPTYINRTINVMAQFDLNDMFQIGAYMVTFQPNEFNMAPILRKLKR